MQRSDRAAGKILVAGYSSINFPDRAFALTRYNADGSLDTSFGSGGRVLSDLPGALKVYLNKPLATNINGYTKFIAADFDANGTVNLTDVLTLLKYYLNKPTGSVVPQWVFLEAPADGTAPLNLAGAAFGKDNVAALTAPIVKDFSSLTDDIQIVDVLRGDVDGSWVPG